MCGKTDVGRSRRAAEREAQAQGEESWTSPVPAPKELSRIHKQHGARQNQEDTEMINQRLVVSMIMPIAASLFSPIGRVEEMGLMREMLRRRQRTVDELKLLYGEVRLSCSFERWRLTTG